MAFTLQTLRAFPTKTESYQCGCHTSDTSAMNRGCADQSKTKALSIPVPSSIYSKNREKFMLSSEQKLNVVIFNLKKRHQNHYSQFSVDNLLQSWYLCLIKRSCLLDINILEGPTRECSQEISLMFVYDSTESLILTVLTRMAHGSYHMHLITSTI